MKYTKIGIGISVLFIALFVVTPVFSIQNALRQNTATNCTVRFVRGRITWTNPALNTKYGGVYNRIGITNSITADPNQHASQFVEVGWYKQIWLNGLILQSGPRAAYTDANGNPQQIVFNQALSSANPSFHIQYDPFIQNQWHFYEQNTWLGMSGSTNMTNGCVAVAGGEVQSHVENMGNTLFDYLERGKINSGGTAYGIKYWNTNYYRLFQGVYTCTLISNWAHRCGP